MSFADLAERQTLLVIAVDWPSGKASPCFWMESEHGKITAAPPIAKWAIGQPTPKVVRWYRGKGATVTVKAVSQ